MSNFIKKVYSCTYYECIMNSKNDLPQYNFSIPNGRMTYSIMTAVCSKITLKYHKSLRIHSYRIQKHLPIIAVAQLMDNTHHQEHVHFYTIENGICNLQQIIKIIFRPVLKIIVYNVKIILFSLPLCNLTV